MLWTLALSGAAWAAETTLLPAGATWRYLDTGVDPGAAWTSPAFDDGAWASGAAQLGYGDGDEATVLGYGGDSANKHITAWFRTAFTVADPSAFTQLELRLLRDDGAIVYLNGVEVVRDNMPDGPVDASTLASNTIGGADEDTFFPFSLAPDELVAGTNVLAVEIHQRSATSSDISLDLELVGTDGLPSVTRGPYLNRVAPDSVVVRWRTVVPTSTQVWAGPDAGSLTLAYDDPTLALEHVAPLTGLAPRTFYTYAVGGGGAVLGGGDADHRFHTSPAPGSSTPFRAWVVGDSGTADANARRVRDAFLGYSAGRTPDLFLMLGDNAYDDGTDNEYQAAVFDTYPSVLRTTPLFPTLGNHDARSADSATLTGVYYDIFTLPRAGESGGTPSGTEAYYSFDYANAHFICLDSEDSSLLPGGPMLTWLEQDLIDTDQDWVIAFWHHPPYTKGSHDSDTEGKLVAMRGNALPILEDYGVDLVLTGHSHSYERTFLIDGHYGLSGTFSPATHGVDGSSGDPLAGEAYHKATPGLAAHEGAVYVVAGSSGKTSAGSLDHPAMFVSLQELGSVVLDIDGNRLDATFLDDAGAEADRFSLVKGRPVLTGPAPGEPGSPSTFTVTGALPLESTFLVLGTRAGATPVPGCPGESLDFEVLKAFPMGPTDAAGVVSLDIGIPAGAAGKTATFQAVQRDRCVLSAPVTYTFP